MKVKALQSVFANLDGSSIRLEVGKVYDVSAESADHLIRGKYAESVEEPVKAVKNAK